MWVSGGTQAMPADDEFIYSTEQLRGRVFRDCAKPGGCAHPSLHHCITASLRVRM